MSKAKKIPEYDFHPQCLIYPSMSDQEFKDKLEYLRDNPQIAASDKVLLAKDLEDGKLKIADGRHFYLACKELGYYPEFETYEGDEAALEKLIDARNFHRRHLNESQRAIIAAKRATAKRGHQTHEANGVDKTIDEAAAQLKVSPRLVHDARKVLENASPEIIAAAETGEVKVSAAKVISTLSKKEQTKVAKGGLDAIKTRARQMRQEAKEDKPAGNKKTKDSPNGSTVFDWTQLKKCYADFTKLMHELEKAYKCSQNRRVVKIRSLLSEIHQQIESLQSDLLKDGE